MPDLVQDGGADLGRDPLEPADGCTLGIDRFIAQHPDGLGLKLSARGGGALPKSVQDAVLIVSALADRPDVILFDEANVGLDHRADAALRALLARLKPETILVLVTYRPSLQALADRRYRLEGGVLVPDLLDIRLRIAVLLDLRNVGLG